MSWLWGSTTNTQYEELVEKACSPLKLAFPQGEDIALNLEITDMIRSKAVQPKQAMQSLKRRVASPNGRVQMYALSLVDTCIKNGGDHFLAEIASKEFIDEMTGVIKGPSTNAEVRQMALRMFQSWALAFEKKRELAFFVDAYHDMKNSGTKFPPPPERTNSSLIETSTAPAWVDSEVCMRCRTAFTFTNRKHHCRNCGLVFDQACSSRTMALPHFGIKEEVRVCESCWVKAGKNKPAPAVPGRTPRTRQDYDADLQRAIELSLAQAQPGAMMGSAPPLALKTGALDDEDEQLRMAIEASLREMEARPSAPMEEELKPLPTFDLNPRETETILTFSNTLDQMAAYGERDLRRFPHAQLLHDQALAIGGKLQRNAEEKSTKAQMLQEMQGKLGEAVALYGRILDGQQAYAQRARYAYPDQLAYQRQQHGYYVPPTQQSYTNGYMQHAPPVQAPPQQVPAQQAQYAPSMYPTMPQAAAPYAYQPQQYAQAPSRQTSYAQYNTPDPQLPTAAPSAPLPTAPNLMPSAPAAASPYAAASAPPPIDMTSHPSMSPRSTTSAVPLPSSPSRQASYAATPSAPSAPARTASYSSTKSPVEAPAAALANPWESAPSAPPQQVPQQQAAPQQAPQQQQAQQPQLVAQGWYTSSMFPSAPGVAPFPSAPQEAPAAKQQQPVEEALLIEL
ncbi:hypothetical protein CC85DRAFT_287190 [Cutaneotrichosporon oleaginosum]|uniref:Vacuolar protein sorting-associated protein 27 n=1 Tax=Cutaneotrichosporon oleaginosum TaxID=879819 RepID=A0A0J0XHT2_9TREE|nr:uncharacterized protein CC85DRAFT_287190 [Cutaneotrichosporon oleaginosum]KLT40680.1 hypothetical protein CC85DRAFT_287190 [Cutaneotrichosporon oleaginosum]TXT14270.1 hypothetical protein COLE_00463 [Cutaneotrichosporon oleaginosum]